MRIAVVCPGAGRVRRGYERYAEEIARRLHGTPGVEVHLLQGGAAKARYETRVPCISRYSGAASVIGRAFGLRPSSVEHYSFGLRSIPRLAAFRADVVILSERILGEVYGRLTRAGILDCRVILANGGSHRPPFRRFDRVHHMSPSSIALALASPTEPPERHVFIPQAIEIDRQLEAPALDGAARSELRRRLDLPLERPVVLSVGNIDDSVKRMGYLIREVARMREARPFLALVGQVDSETDALRSLARAQLGDENFVMKSVEPKQLADFYNAADVFVLASLREAFGRVYVEALAHGLPCIVHDTPHTRWLFGEHAKFIDAQKMGALSFEIPLILHKGRQAEEWAARHAFAYSRFSWDTLWPQYLEMLTRWAPES